mgnify:CR=1 FL=1
MKRGKSGSSKEVVGLKIQLARALADYDNLRKRVDQERQVWIDFSSERVLTKLLPVLDMFEAAQNHLNDPGLAISIGEFKKILSEEGIEEIRVAKGDDFDEQLHEAVEVVEESPELVEGKKGKISELVLTGWKLMDRKVIRHAKVKVYGERK